MCIGIQKHISVTQKEQIAWKVVAISPSESHWYPLFHTGLFDTGKWEKALHPTYGFNVFISKKAAEDYREMQGGEVRKVKVRRIHGQGTWMCATSQLFTVLFAREIYVPKRGRTRLCVLK